MRQATILLLLALASAASSATEFGGTPTWETGANSTTRDTDQTQSCIKFAKATFPAAPSPVGVIITPATPTAQGTCRYAASQSNYDTGNWLQVGIYQQAAAAACQANKQAVLNFTVGWTNVDNDHQPPDGYTLGVQAPGMQLPSGTACDGTCTMTVGAPVAGWQSETPTAQGLYRLSIDYVATATGATCSAKTPALDTSAAPATCSGYAGLVNGKSTCVMATPPAATGQPSTAGPVDRGNPPAASNAASSPASRIPASGSGGNPGGPQTGVDGAPRGGGAVAPPGTGPSTGGTGGTPADTKPKDPCGLPGTPQCNVKVDETGTPSTADLSGPSGRFDTAAQSERDGITAAGQRVTGLSWSWGFTLPTGSCTPMQLHSRLGDMTVDPCNSPLVQLWRQLAAYMLYIMAALYIWRLATSNVTPGGK